MTKETSTQEVCPALDTSKVKMADTNYPSVVKWEHWLKLVGVHEATGRRWREKGMIEPSINIHGKLYLTTEDIGRFVACARRGQFAKEIRVPLAPGSSGED